MATPTDMPNPVDIGHRPNYGWVGAPSNQNYSNPYTGGDSGELALPVPLSPDYLHVTRALAPKSSGAHALVIIPKLKIFTSVNTQDMGTKRTERK